MISIVTPHDRQLQISVSAVNCKEKDVSLING